MELHAHTRLLDAGELGTFFLGLLQHTHIPWIERGQIWPNPATCSWLQVQDLFATRRVDGRHGRGQPRAHEALLILQPLKWAHVRISTCGAIGDIMLPSSMNCSGGFGVSCRSFAPSACPSPKRSPRGLAVNKRLGETGIGFFLFPFLFGKSHCGDGLGFEG